MILYTFTEGLSCEPRYYFNYGEMVYELFGLNSNVLTPWNPVLQDGSNPEMSEENASDFLRDFIPPLYVDIGIDEWPLPVYGWTATPENKENSVILRTFLCCYLLPKYWETYILPWAKEETEQAQQETVQKFYDNFMQLIVATFNKYLPIIKAYKAKESSLMARLGSESHSISRFNDTPQNGGDFADEGHTTNATTADNETLSDYETPINRLREIRDKFEDLYNAWAKDFDILFTKGESNEL